MTKIEEIKAPEKINIKGKIYRSDSKIEVKTEHYYGSYEDGERKVFYRIVPSELKWYERIFCNPWRPVWHAYEILGGCTICFGPMDFKKHKIMQIKTLGDMYVFLETQNEIAKHNTDKEERERLFKIANGELWAE